MVPQYWFRIQGIDVLYRSEMVLAMRKIVGEGMGSELKLLNALLKQYLCEKQKSLI